LSAFGWATDKLTKKIIIDTLAPEIRQQNLAIYFPEIIGELKNFIITDSGECKAAPSKHDDHVLAAAIAVYNLGACTQYRLGGPEALNSMRLKRDPRYLAPDGFVRDI
jgi:uncharacterized membrane protein YgcG